MKEGVEVRVTHADPDSPEYEQDMADAEAFKKIATSPEFAQAAASVAHELADLLRNTRSAYVGSLPGVGELTDFARGQLEEQFSVGVTAMAAGQMVVDSVHRLRDPLPASRERCMAVAQNCYNEVRRTLATPH